jgi:hypothetical protein
MSMSLLQKLKTNTMKIRTSFYLAFYNGPFLFSQTKGLEKYKERNNYSTLKRTIASVRGIND